MSLAIGLHFLVTANKYLFCSPETQGLTESSRFPLALPNMFLSVQAAFPNFSFDPSCGGLTHSACTTHFLLHSPLWRLSHDAKLTITTDRARSFETTHSVIRPLIGHDKKNKNSNYGLEGIGHLSLVRHELVKGIVAFTISLWLGKSALTHQERRYFFFLQMRKCNARN